MKSKMIKYLMFTIFLTSFFSCDSEEFIANNLPAEYDIFARDYINIIKSKDFDSAYTLLTDTLKKTSSPEEFQPISEYLIGFDSTLTPIRFNISTTTLLYSSDNKEFKETYIDIDYKADLKVGWVYINILIEDSSNTYKVSNFYVNHISQSIEELNSLSTTNANIFNYLSLLLSILFPLFIIYTLVYLFKSDFEKKWLWFIFIFLGLGKFGFYWGTYEFSYDFFSFMILGAGVSKPNLLSPYIFTLSFPLGAIIFHIKRNKIFDRLPRKMNCPNCNIFLELEDIERIEKKFTCSSCNENINLT
jgi:hypothetical protein